MTLRSESEGEESFSELLTVVVPEDGYDVKQRIFSGGWLMIGSIGSHVSHSARLKVST